MELVSDQVFSNIIEETKKMKYAMPNKTIEVLAKYQVNRVTEQLNLSEDDEGILIFQVLYTLR